MTPRLVATDLDGTLLHSDGTVTARTRAVLDELDGLGVPVVFTTGRPIRWMEELWADVGGHGLAICSNGGIVYDVAERRVRDFSAVPREVGMELAELLRAAVPGTTFAVEHTSGWASEHGFPRHPDDGRHPAPGRRGSRSGPTTWSRSWPCTATSTPRTFWRRVEAAVGALVTTTWSSTFALVEISAAGVTKATTLATVAAEMGLGPQDVVAFGDMPNDLPMLEWAGTSYAMANAHPSVRDLADHLAPGNDDDGVAVVLADLFSLRR